jgi:hypothetical protein
MMTVHRHLLAASTIDDRLSIFRPPNNRLMSEWVEVRRSQSHALPHATRVTAQAVLLQLTLFMAVQRLRVSLIFSTNI